MCYYIFKQIAFSMSFFSYCKSNLHINGINLRQLLQYINFKGESLELYSFHLLQTIMSTLLLNNWLIIQLTFILLNHTFSLN